MDIRKVKKLITLLQESGIAEIEIHEGEESVRIRRSNPQTAVPNVLVEPPFDPPTPADKDSTPHTSPPAHADADTHIIKSPMVGIFYTAPSPNASPYIKVGQTIRKGEVICIIEAMKIMNQIEADTTGVVEKILVEDSHPIEFGEPLFSIKKTNG